MDPAHKSQAADRKRLSFPLAFPFGGGMVVFQDLRITLVIASAAKQSRHAASEKTGLPRLLRRLAMTLCVSPIFIELSTGK
jgi:hypothetical protein